MTDTSKFKTVKLADKGEAVDHNHLAKQPIDDTDTPKEIDGRKEGLDPVRYGDWEHKGKCVDF